MHCVCCAGSDFEPLPNPHPAQSMLSDFRILTAPLAKAACRRCGAIRRLEQIPPKETFGQGYDLYAHAPGRGEEAARQASYAKWIASSTAQPRSLFEAGAGNGSLLCALREHWPQTQFSGVEPAEAAADHARKAGFLVGTAFLEHNRGGRVAGAALAVNVLEHVPDPVEFIRALGSHGEQIIVITPDGDRCSSELLIADHLHSLGRAHISAIFASAGYAVTRQQSAPAEIGSFLLTAGRRGTAPQQAALASAPVAHAYLQQWARLEGTLLERASGRPLVCFGAGEAAALLRAYTPALWNRVQACVMDAPHASNFGELPLRELERIAPSTVLIGARPAVQPRIAARLELLGHSALRWDDLVES